MADHAVPVSPSPDCPPRLVGREREWGLLHERLTAALAGRGGLVLIGGEAGIGKTALAEALGCEAEARGALVLVGRCYDLTETPPYGPWVELFARLPTGDDRSRLPAPLGHGDAAASQQALFARARDELATLTARQPLLLLLDDLHWADPASLDLLRALAREVAALPILLLATYRSDEVTRRHPLAQLLPLLIREARAARLDLRPLDEAAVRALLRARYDLGADEGRLAAYLRAHAEGNPFYLGELLRTLEEEGVLRETAGGWVLGDLGRVGVPALLRQVIEGRLARLGEEAQRLLAIAAVIGQEVPLALWAAVTGAGEDALADTVERAVEAHMLEEAPAVAGLRFAHALIREALHEGLPLPRRRASHRRVGEALAALPGADPDAVAYHFQQAGDPRAAEWLLRAGARARRVYAWLTAAERWEAALRLLEQQGAEPAERGWLLFRLAALRRYSDPRQGLSYLEEAARLGAESADRGLTAYALVQRGLLRCLAGSMGQGIADMEAGVDALEALPPAEQARVEARLEGMNFVPAMERGMLVQWLAYTGRYARARRMGEAVIARAPHAHAVEGAGGSALADAHLGLLHAYAALGQPDDARLAYARARDEYRAAEHFYNVGSTGYWALLTLALPYAADDLNERRRLAEEAEEAARRASGSVDAAFPPRAMRLPLLVLEGGWAEARALAAQARGTSVERRVTAALAPLAREQGDPELASTPLRSWLPAGPATEPGDTWFLYALVLQRLAAALSLDAGDLPTAREWLAAHDRWLAWSGAVLWRAEGHLGWAAYHGAAGNLAEARKHAEEGLRHATEPRQPLALLAAHRALGELETAAGRHGEAEAHLDAALALADACAAPYERALALLALAELRAATGKREGARALLDEARAICTPLEARPALARADALTARLASVPPPRQVYPAGLTAREVEVLRLVAQGLSDAEVAARLSLSPRTVTTHLTSVYNKLGVSSRLAAARFAIEHQLA